MTVLIIPACCTGPQRFDLQHSAAQHSTAGLDYVTRDGGGGGDDDDDEIAFLLPCQDTEGRREGGKEGGGGNR